METPQQQRARILSNGSPCTPAEYDLAVTLGYQPERWDGMWKLPAENPFTITRHGVIIREISTKRRRNGDAKIRARLRPTPIT